MAPNAAGTMIAGPRRFHLSTSPASDHRDVDAGYRFRVLSWVFQRCVACLRHLMAYGSANK